tara:strand:- start:118775 stop:119815 length:1041 start_codon:yes stop_codon:yes gene_type:complete
MSSGLLPDHIEPLVDRLRAGDHLPIALPDVAAVTEVLMRSLESYFKSIDLTLYKECQDLADYIDDARSEISSLSPDGDDSAGIPRAGKELDAIVEATESATDTIMQAAEDLMSFDSDDFGEYKEHVNTEVMKIFEACSFQDITGQRISKVVRTLNHVEDRVGKLISILGISSNNETPKDAKPILDTDTDEVSDEELLNGPALAGEGIDQGEIDSLLGDFDSVPTQNDSVTDNVAVETHQHKEEIEATEDVEEAEVTEDVEEAVVAEKAEVTEAVEEAEVIEAAEVIEEAAVAEEQHNEPEPQEDLKSEPEVQEKIKVAAERVEAANTVDEDNQKETSQEDIDSLFG